MSRIKIVALVVTALAFVGVLSSCGDIGKEYATSTSDTHVCVFDGSERGGQKLKFQVAPGEESKEIDDNDQVVKIPTSNRFWMVSSNRSIADPGTPNNYTGNALEGVPVFIEGQIRFRFNPALACEWYSKHGRRNADSDGNLGFNARGGDAANAGWFKFGNENFVLTMQEVISEEMAKYDAEALHYNTPDDSDRPIRQVLADDLGAAYTERLTANLGGEYFCGIGEAEGDDQCPGMTFQVVYAGPGNDSPLVTQRDAVEAERRALEAARDQAELKAAQSGYLLEAERNEQQLLSEQVKTAQLKAAAETAKCALLAQYGLDCEGHHPTYIVPGQ